jgi:xanthine dehydrogenase accessory factor
MAQTLADLARALGWEADVRPDLSAADLDARSIVVVATQGHGDEDAVERAVSAQPAFVGLVASRKRGEAVLGYLADRGVPRTLLDRVHVPVGLDLGRTTHREIAVAILAQLVQSRAAGALTPDPAQASAPPPAEATRGPASSGLRSAGSEATGATREGDATEAPGPARAERAPFGTDPVCGMTVRADASSHPFEHDGVTYHFCCVGCRDAFARDPHAYHTSQEA